MRMAVGASLVNLIVKSDNFDVVWVFNDDDEPDTNFAELLGELWSQRRQL